jgi:hypothetical protein
VAPVTAPVGAVPLPEPGALRLDMAKFYHHALDFPLFVDTGLVVYSHVILAGLVPDPRVCRLPAPWWASI